MNWPKETCTNCQEQSYTLAKRGLCPFCSKDLFIERLIENGLPTEEHPKFLDLDFSEKTISDPDFIKKIEDHVKKYKVNINKEEIKNIILFQKLWKQ
jgi:hypothetical protein